MKINLGGFTFVKMELYIQVIGFKYKAAKEEDYTLTRLTKEQMLEIILEKRKRRLKYRT